MTIDHSEPQLRFTKNLKVAILYELLDQVHKTAEVNRKKPIIFSSSSLAENLGVYQPSVSRELRTLKQINLLRYEIVDRLKGEYKLLLQSPKWNKGAFEAELLKSISELNNALPHRPGYQIKQMLNEVRNRRISGVHP
jgi:hypothetical protein